MYSICAISLSTPGLPWLISNPSLSKDDPVPRNSAHPTIRPDPERRRGSRKDERRICRDGSKETAKTLLTPPDQEKGASGSQSRGTSGSSCFAQGATDHSGPAQRQWLFGTKRDPLLSRIPRASAVFSSRHRGRPLPSPDQRSPTASRHRSPLPSFFYPADLVQQFRSCLLRCRPSVALPLIQHHDHSSFLLPTGC